MSAACIGWTRHRQTPRRLHPTAANKCLEVLFQYLTQLISSPDWRARHVAFMAISCVGEGTYDVMNGSMGQVLQMVLALREDPHPRVRYAVCHCLGQLATDFEVGPDGF